MWPHLLIYWVSMLSLMLSKEKGNVKVIGTSISLRQNAKNKVICRL